MTPYLDLLERPGMTVVTATRRLARALLEAHGDRQAERGARAWRTPRVLCWDDWVAESWSQLALAPGRERLRPVLNDSQELLLFERAIDECMADRADAVLVPLFATARAALDAWNLAHDWRLPYDELARCDDADCAMFKRWADSVRRTLADRRWITRAQLPMALSEAVAAASWKPSGALAVVGFDEIAPARRELLERLRQAGVEVTCPPAAARRGRTYTIGLADRQAEIRAAAAWARRLLESGAETPIGIVVPDLNVTRDAVDRMLRRTLHPEAPIADLEQAPLYHISLGRRLRDYPLVHCALTLLRWCQAPIDHHELAHLLHSPFIADAAERLTQRAELALTLRVRDQIAITDLRRHLAADDSSGLRSAIDAAGDLLPTVRERARAVEWAERFSVMLRAFGWPAAALSSSEQQTLDAWHEVLSRLASLGAVSPPMSAAEALRRLTQLMTTRVFQPRAPAAPVQVLGIAEAAGLQFSHLWIVGMSDELWPPPPRPNPFLPLPLQRRFDLPAATAARQLVFSEVVSRRLCACADDIVISYGRRAGEQTQHLSPMFVSLSPWPAATTAAADHDFAITIQRAAGPLQALDDDRAPAVAPGDAVRGGAGLLRDQAACPFRAFARYRLGARAGAVREPGLDAAERGTLVHACLAGVWRALGDSDGLHARSVADLRALVADRVANAVATRTGHEDGSFARAVDQIEEQRLLALVMEWLDLERGRPPFTVVETESRATLELAGLSLQLQIDRVDEYGDGRRLLIDYKTARTGRISMWSGARPEEPQLPAYFLARRAPDGLAFARVRRGACAFIGAANGDSPAAGVRAIGEAVDAELGVGWDQLSACWMQVLANLAAGFARGEAAVDPRDERACTHCDITPLCRVFDQVER